MRSKAIAPRLAATIALGRRTKVVETKGGYSPVLTGRIGKGLGRTVSGPVLTSNFPAAAGVLTKMSKKPEEWCIGSNP